MGEKFMDKIFMDEKYMEEKSLDKEFWVKHMDVIYTGKKIW